MYLIIHTFTRWNDDVTATPRTDTITDNLSVSATFLLSITKPKRDEHEAKPIDREIDLDFDELRGRGEPQNVKPERVSHLRLHIGAPGNTRVESIGTMATGGIWATEKF